MSHLPQKKLSDWLDDHSTLTKLHEKVRELQRLNEVFLQYLETPLNQFCRLANYRDNILIIQVESAAWATRLRYQIPALKIQLRHQAVFADLRDIEIHVHPFKTPMDLPHTHTSAIQQKREYSTRNTLQQPKLSAKSAKLLKETANSIADETLSNALKRLAENE